MRGANVVRRRSGTNPGETAGATGAVNGGQADGGSSGLLAGGASAGGGSGLTAPAGLATPAEDLELRSDPSSPQWTSPGYAGAPSGNAAADAPEVPAEAGAPVDPPPA